LGSFPVAFLPLYQTLTRNISWYKKKDNAIDAKSSGFIKYYHYAGFTPFAIHVHEEEPIADWRDYY
jgi:hypothetical protein